MFDFLAKRFGSLFGSLGNKKLTSDNIQHALQDIVNALLEADVPYDLAQSFVAEVKDKALGQNITKSLKPDQQFIKIIYDHLKLFLGGDAAPCMFNKKDIVLIMGLQGSGKTTSIAKLVHMALQQGAVKKILVASVDFYRPAALDQLELLAKKCGADFYRSPKINPVEASVDIAEYAKQHNYDLLFLDTAGRLHINDAMLQELKEIKTLLDPTYSILVLDAMTGQESLSVARSFDQTIGFQYGMLTKMDSDTRGGAVFSFRYALKKPIAFIGTGEKYDDIAVFNPERIAGRILDMGDVVTLAEKAEKKFAQDDQKSMFDALSKGRLTLKDFAKQMEMVGRLGSMGSLMKYLPGMGAFNLSSDMIQKGEQELKRFQAILSSMTEKEKDNPSILDNSRKNRIAKGAGLQVSDVNLLLSRFEQSQQYVKLLSKFGRGQGFFK